jgi:pimeloyl-ACP methyl ester carboxylesterase
LIEPPAITLFVSDPPLPTELLALLLRRPRAAAALIRFARSGAMAATAAAKRGDVAAAVERSGRAVLGGNYFQCLSKARREQVFANGIREEFLASFPPLPTSALRELNVATLLLNGRDSPAVFRRIVERLHELLPRSERVEIERASHIVHEDQPAAFAAAVRRFLTERA